MTESTYCTFYKVGFHVMWLNDKVQPWIRRDWDTSGVNFLTSAEPMLLLLSGTAPLPNGYSQHRNPVQNRKKFLNYPL